MSKLVIIRGLPGSGKSTLAQTFTGYLHFEADMYFVDDKGNYTFNPSHIKNAHQWCQQSVRTALEHGHNVVVSNTFVKKWEMDFYIRLQPHADVITCCGDYGNIHNVPDEVIQRMKNTWED